MKTSNKIKILITALVALMGLVVIIARYGKSISHKPDAASPELSLTVAGPAAPSGDMEAVRRMLGVKSPEKDKGVFSGPEAEKLYKANGDGEVTVSQSTAAQKIDYAATLLAYAEQGNIPAQNLLAEAYLTGRGAKQDHAEAFKWFKRSAGQGNAAAQFKLGGLYYTGSGVKRDLPASLDWLRRSAEGGYAPAQAALGAKYIAGEDMPEDIMQGLDWVRKAAVGGHEPSQFQLGSMLYYGRSAAVDKVEALKWFRMSAESGNPQAQFNAGLMLAKGDGVPPDYEEALKWLVLASGSSAAALSADASRAMAAVEGTLAPEAAARARAEAEELKKEIAARAGAAFPGPKKK